MDFLHHSEKGSSRVDIKNRKNPWIHLVVADMQHVQAPEYAGLLGCKKGVIVLTRQRQQRQRLGGTGLTPAELVPEESSGNPPILS